MEQIRVLLVEDDPFWQRAIGKLLHEDEEILLLGTADNKDDAVRLAQKSEVDVVLVDVVLTGNQLDGLEAALDICAMRQAKVVMLTSLRDQDIIAEAFSAGAVNFVTKEHFGDIPNVIRSAATGVVSIHPCASEGVLQELVRLKREERTKLLSFMEKEILRLIDSGHTYSQIQSILYIAERTIKNHVNRILKKIKVKSGKDAAAIARKKGMI